MTTSDKLREIAHKYGGAIITGYGQSSASGSTEMFTAEEQCLSDLTALLEQHKEMILREELIKFGDYFNECVSKTIYTSLIDEYLKSREK